MRIFTILCAAMIVVSPAWSSAQDRVRVGIDGAQQMTSTNVRAATTFTEFIEEGRITTQERVGSGPMFGGHVSVALWKQLSIGTAVSYYSKSTHGTVEAQIPHPFLFERDRVVSGSAAGLNRTELATHLFAAWTVPADRVELTFFGGPSIFHINQDLVSSVIYTQAYPFDAAQFAGVATTPISGNSFGFHTGAGASWKLNRRAGFGVTLRYARGKYETALDTGSVSFNVGGLHAGGGLRLGF